MEIHEAFVHTRSKQETTTKYIHTQLSILLINHHVLARVEFFDNQANIQLSVWHSCTQV